MSRADSYTLRAIMDDVIDQQASMTIAQGVPTDGLQSEILTTRKKTREVAHHNHHCRVCFAPATAVCGRCRLLPYCSRECQRVDWPVHKLLCPNPASSTAVPGREASKCSREHIELRMETWSLRKVRAAVEEGRVNPREFVLFAEHDSTANKSCKVCPVLAIAVTRAHVRMVEYLLAKGAICSPHLSLFMKDECNCIKKLGLENAYDVIEHASCRLLRIVMRTCERKITRARFAQYVSRVARCLRLVVKASQNPKKEFIRLSTALIVFAKVDFLAAIMGCHSRLTAAVIDACECKELAETSYMKFAYLYASSAFADVKVSIINDESEEKLVMLSSDLQSIERFAHVALGRMIAGETDIRFDYHKKEMQSEMQPEIPGGRVVSDTRRRGATCAIEIQKVRTGSRVYHK